MAPALNVLQPALAAEITGIDLGGGLDAAQMEWFVAAWRHHAVLVFRDQALTPEAQRDFSRRLGELDLAPAFDVDRSDLAGYPEIAVVSNIVVNGAPIGGLGDGELAWHSDMTYEAAPPVACLLLARELPGAGGDTHYLDLRAGWRTLPEALQRRASYARIFHDRAYTSAGTPRLDARAGDGVWHPVRIADPVSGEPTLLLGRRRESRIVAGDDMVEDGTLLEALWHHADRAEHVYRHVWRPGDAVLWNNLAVMHRRDAFDAAARRLLHRTQIRRLHPHWEPPARAFVG
jgi:taurine dioxygenase